MLTIRNHYNILKYSFRLEENILGFYLMTEANVNLFVEYLNPDSKEKVLFLHGWPGSHRLFEYQLNELGGSKGVGCIAPDQRGFGSSDKPAYGYDYDTLADDVRSVIDQLGLKDITLVGHSTGGAIAIRYMARHHGYGVSKLVLCAAAAPSLIKRPNFPYGQPEEAIIDIIEGTYKDRPKMLKDFGDMFFYQYISEAFQDWFFQLGLEAAGWATAKVAMTWIKEVLFQDMRKIYVPTLIMHGRHDLVCPFPLAEAQNNEIKNSKLLVFEESGHGLFYDEKDRFNKVLLDFIRE